jgi:hypothetical protein
MTGPSENQLHAAVADYLDWMLLPPAFFTTFPAGGYVLPRSGAGLLKRKGLKAGFPDIILFYDGRTIGIELKVANNKPTPVQMGTLARLREAGIHCYICRDVDRVQEVLKEEGFPLRRTDPMRSRLQEVHPTRESLT